VSRFAASTGYVGVAGEIDDDWGARPRHRGIDRRLSVMSAASGSSQGQKQFLRRPADHPGRAGSGDQWRLGIRIKHAGSLGSKRTDTSAHRRLR